MLSPTIAETDVAPTDAGSLSTETNTIVTLDDDALAGVGGGAMTDDGRTL